MGKARAFGSLAVAAALLAGCSGSGGSDGAKTTTTDKSKATTTTTIDVKEEAAKAFQKLVDDADSAIEQESLARDQFAGDNDLESAIESTKDLRNDLFDFDADVRKLDVPDDATSALNDLLTEDGHYIEVLDGFVDITEIPDYNDQFDKETNARDDWYRVANALAEALDAEPVEFAPEPSDTSSTTAPTQEEFGAGDTVSTPTLSVEVPEGFTATASATILMEDDNGSQIGFYGQSSDEATLEAVAKTAAEGTAEKNEYKIIGGPEKLDVGDYPGVAYSFDPGESRTIVEIWYEGTDAAGSKWHLISVEADDDQIDAVMDALMAVLPSVSLS
jgi:hypothetical protein